MSQVDWEKCGDGVESEMCCVFNIFIENINDPDSNNTFLDVLYAVVCHLPTGPDFNW